MPKSNYYSPQIQRFLVCALYHEAQAQRVPMTVLTNHLLRDSLRDTDGWRKALESGHTLERGDVHPQQSTQRPAEAVSVGFLFKSTTKL